MIKPTLVIMAAGMGSRYGGLKQIDPIDHDGHIIMDFSLFDAKRAGFEDVIFIIKKQDEDIFKEAIGYRIEKIMNVHYVFQELTNIPQGYSLPEERIKPLGTAHAIYCCKDVIQGPFAVINADDYYGVHAFQTIYDYLSTHQDDDFYRFAMVGYYIEKTLTDNGTVARGVCQTNNNNELTSVTERTKIKAMDHEVVYTEDEQTWHTIPYHTLVSMNLWGFSHHIFDELETGLKAFLNNDLPQQPLKAEYFIPSVVSHCIEENKAKVKVLSTSDQWYGITYRQDKPMITAAIQKMKDEGLYPQKLWEENK